MTATRKISDRGAAPREEIDGLEDVLCPCYPTAIKFEYPGTVHVLEVAGAGVEQERDYDTGQRLTWDDGRPKMIAAIYGTVDEAEEGTWWVRGRRAERALRDGMKEAGIRKLAKGDKIQVTRGEDEKVEPKRPGGKVTYANTYLVEITPAGS